MKGFSSSSEKDINEEKARRNEELARICEEGLDALGREIGAKEAAINAARAQRDFLASALGDRVTRFHSLQVVAGHVSFEQAAQLIRGELEQFERHGAAIAKEHGIEV